MILNTRADAEYDLCAYFKYIPESLYALLVTNIAEFISYGVS